MSDAVDASGNRNFREVRSLVPFLIVYQNDCRKDACVIQSDHHHHVVGSRGLPIVRNSDDGTKRNSKTRARSETVSEPENRESFHRQRKTRG
jgi:hypothetical protein